MAQDIAALLKEYAEFREMVRVTELLPSEGDDPAVSMLRRGFAECYDALLTTGKVIWIPCEPDQMPTAGKKVWAWCTAEGGFSFWGHWNWQEPIWVDPCGKGPYPVSHWAEIRWPHPPQTDSPTDKTKEVKK